MRVPRLTPFTQRYCLFYLHNRTPNQYGGTSQRPRFSAFAYVDNRKYLQRFSTSLHFRFHYRRYISRLCLFLIHSLTFDFVICQLPTVRNLFSYGIIILI
uniref:Uncharacterized protein n=1 Tax=Cacopsylla melanoneura TaxID=428564 RepID=A0A8D8RAW2_9HEMI